MKNKLKKLNLVFDDIFYDRIDQYIALLQQWGKIHNLTANLFLEDIEKNIIDSIYPLKFLNDYKNIADIGTGAGYPGMLLAIALPTIKVTLIEPRTKRVAFLNFVKSALKLDNVTVLRDRVEDIKDMSFDLITSRAVTNTSLLMELTSNITDKNTDYLFYKGSLCQDEVEDIGIKKYKIIKVGTHRNYLYINKDNKC